MRRHTPLEDLPGLVDQWMKALGLEVSSRFLDSGDSELFPNRMVLEGPDAALFSSGRCAPLDALQFLLHEAQGVRDDSKLAYLDVGGQRLFRMREITSMAEFAATKARESGSYTFKSLTPRERRWVHLVVARTADLHSESEGTGTLKSLKVLRK
jgi:predicted RNA-binding protein Jag